jgi:hypothetical protein
LCTNVRVMMGSDSSDNKGKGTRYVAKAHC